MQYGSFYKYFTDVARKETREVVVTREGSPLSGSYGLLEMYCMDPECDCRRVMLNVVSEKEKKSVAVIDFGWESEDFYREWIGGDDEIKAKELKGPCLNIEREQSEHAPEVLLVVTNVVLKDTAYVDRLKRHYSMFKEKMREVNKKQGGES